MKDPKQKRHLPPAAIMGISAGLTGAALAGVPAALRRGTPLKTVFRNAGLAGAGAGALGAASVLIGNRVLGEPKAKDNSAYTKRGATGGVIGGGIVGGLLGGTALLRKLPGVPRPGGVVSKAARGLVKPVRSLRRSLFNPKTTFRPAAAVQKRPWLAPVVGAAGGATYAGYQGADDGSAVDVLHAPKKRFAAIICRATAPVAMAGGAPALQSRPILFAEPLLTGRLASDRYRKKIDDEDRDRGDAKAGRAAAAGALAGALAPKKLGRFGLRVGGGLVGGVLAVKAVRGVTSGSKDAYGERTRRAKQAESLPAYAGLIGAGLLARKRLQSLGKKAAVDLPDAG